MTMTDDAKLRRSLARKLKSDELKTRDLRGLAGALKECVYIVKQDRIALRSTTALITRAAFNYWKEDIAPAGSTGVKAAFAVFMNSGGAVAQDVTYAPGEEEIFERVMNGKAETVFNTWRPGPIQPTPFTVAREEISLWLDHVNFILPDPVARELFLNYASTLIQHPGMKINFGFLLLGLQGIGKDLLLLPITRILGAANVKTIKSSQLNGNFNPFVETQLVVVGELPAYHKRDFYDALKDFLASGQDHISVNKKNLNEYWIENSANWFLFSNHRDALAIPEDDRRVFAYWSPAEKKPPAYYQALGKAYEDGAFLTQIATYLADRDLSAFDPKAAPPETEAKAAMREYSRDPVDIVIAEMFEDGGAFYGRQLVTPREIFSEVTSMKTHREIDDETARKITPDRIGKRLPRLGAKKLEGKHRVEGENPEYVWAVVEHAKYAKLLKDGDATKLREQFKQDKVAAKEKQAEKWKEELKEALHVEHHSRTAAEIVDFNRRRGGAS